MRKIFLSLTLSLFALLGFGVQAQTASTGRTQVLVETSKGKFILELFDETPLHKAAFLKNVREGRYNGTLFHRVIKGFMVQGGNVLSKGLKEQDVLEDDSVGTIEPEFRTSDFVHVRGMLAAAREGDEVNPKKKSSASQFYIVTGKYYTALDMLKESDKNGVKYSDEQRKAYMTEGGAAHLDGAYTIFGRLIEGYKVVDKIQQVETNEDDRPLKNIVVKQMTIIKE